MSGTGLSTEALRPMLDRAFSECVNTIKNNSRNAGQVATGKTLRSLEYRIKEKGAGYVATILGRPYFGSLETGRGAYRGGKADPMEFNKRLIEWMKARGITCKDEEEYLRLANYLRWKINKFGTVLFRKGGRKDIFTPAVADLTGFIEKELVVFFTTSIEESFTRGIKDLGNNL